MRTLVVTPSGATWKASLMEALTEGAYTAQAEQSDVAGNTIRSAPSTFTDQGQRPRAVAEPRRRRDRQPGAELRRGRRRRARRYRGGDAEDLPGRKRDLGVPSRRCGHLTAPRGPRALAKHSTRAPTPHRPNNPTAGKHNQERTVDRHGGHDAAGGEHHGASQWGELSRQADFAGVGASAASRKTCPR